MKKKNINLYGLFRKFDKDNNGLISNIDLNRGLRELFNINSAIGDSFFVYLDYYHMGIVDFDTFTSRINYLEKNRDNEYELLEEKEILKKIKNFIEDYDVSFPYKKFTNWN